MTPWFTNSKQTNKQKLPTKKTPGSDVLTSKFYKNFSEDLAPICLKLVKEFGKKSVLPKSFS